MALDLNSVVPEPRDLKDLQCILWRTDQWGTKWNSYERTGGDVRVDPNGTATLSCRFMTAYGPPLPVLEKLAEFFPNVSLQGAFLEEFGEVAGTFEASAGLLKVHEDEAEPIARSEFGLIPQRHWLDEMLEDHLNSPEGSGLRDLLSRRPQVTN
jgi:hypothetical protein